MDELGITVIPLGRVLAAPGEARAATVEALEAAAAHRAIEARQTVGKTLLMA